MKSIFALFLLIGMASAFSIFTSNQDQTSLKGWPKPETTSLGKDMCRCRMRTNNRIVGGSEVNAHSIPWQVSLSDSNKNILCGGTIINSKLILTAASCIYTLEPSDVNVHVGMHQLKDLNIEKNMYKVAAIYSHQFAGAREKGDIAILELNSEIEFNQGQIEPACFNTDKKTYNQNLMTSGWGMTSSSYSDDETGNYEIGEFSNVLKKVDLLEVKKDCENFLVCVKAPEQNSMCNGDNGGPLLYTKNGKTSVEGVLSSIDVGISSEHFISDCIGSGAFSRLNYYNKWFNYLTSKNYCTTNF